MKSHVYFLLGRRGVNSKQLAYLLGVSPSLISLIFNGHRSPADKLLAIAKELAVTVETLNVAIAGEGKLAALEARLDLEAA